MTSASSKNVLDLTTGELRKRFAALSIEPYRAEQIHRWIYEKGVYDFDKMTNLSLPLRERLKEEFVIDMPRIVQRLRSDDDKSVKLLLKLNDGNLVEAVYMSAAPPRRIRPRSGPTDSPSPRGEPVKTRETVCVSSQVGCKFHCAFCASGQAGFFRNLSMGEITAQILAARDQSPEKKISNIVFMGIGEPFDNYTELLRTIRQLNAKSGLGLGARRITISTCGVVPKIEKLATEGLQVELSVSLHGPTDTVRGAILPVNKAFPVKPLIDACKKYTKATKRAITFEYILISGVNASLHEAKQLGKLLEGMLCKVNLIPYNLIEEFPHEPPAYPDIVAFQKTLQQYGVKTTVRFSKGQDIQAACGQLRSVQLKKP